MVEIKWNTKTYSIQKKAGKKERGTNNGKDREQITAWLI